MNGKAYIRLYIMIWGGSSDSFVYW